MKSKQISVYLRVFSVYLRVTIPLFLFHTLASAQQKPSEFNEFSIYCGAGLTLIPYELSPDARFLTGSDLHFGAGYTHFFRKNWGIHIGVGPTFYKVKQNIDMNFKNSDLTDSNGYQFDLFTIADYNETRKMTFFTVPLMLQYEPKPKRQKRVWWKNNKPDHVFYAMGGIKASMPFTNRYEGGIKTISNKAYYPEMDNWAATQKFAGLGEFAGKSAEGEFELGLSFTLALEAGIKWRLNGYKYLYTGLYFDYGLNNIDRTKISRMPVRNNVNTEYFTDFTILTYPDKIQIMSIGINARLAFYRAPNDCKHNPYRQIKPKRNYKNTR